jgi:hypothetical protein
LYFACKELKRIQYGNKEKTGEFLSIIPYETERVPNENDAYEITKEC